MQWYFLGNVNDDVGFYYEEGTTVEFGCGATLMGEFYYFGGYEAHKRQVTWNFSMIID